MEWLWAWTGRCVGYRDGDDLWTDSGRHVGRFLGDEVYDLDGHPSRRAGYRPPDQEQRQGWRYQDRLRAAAAESVDHQTIGLQRLPNAGGL